MTYQNQEIADIRELLGERFSALENKADILKAPEIKVLFDKIKTLPTSERGSFGKEVNNLRQELQEMVYSAMDKTNALPPIDITAPTDVNADLPELLPSSLGSRHPLMVERDKIIDIFYRMGFDASESREVDDQYHMFESLNFPKNHPARDDYDTFLIDQLDENGDRLVAPAHTSTMQNRILLKYKDQLFKGRPIAVVVPDRVFRNEDVDARHGHTFYQIEGIYVSKKVNVGMLIATLKQFLQEYYGQKLEVRVNPFYFPFTEPSFEFALSCPFCKGEDISCKVCGGEGWIELLGCGMIHPNVLKSAGINPADYTGFAFGCGIDRLVMMKYGIEDVRHFHSGRLDFLKQFV